MDRDRSEGKGKKIGGAIKKAVGKITGNKRLEREGRADKAKGKIQSAVGSAKDTVRHKTR
jgi:uncharacterized protein YjbJ (UPF0337 family)